MDLDLDICTVGGATGGHCAPNIVVMGLTTSPHSCTKCVSGIDLNKCYVYVSPAMLYYEMLISTSNEFAVNQYIHNMDS